MFVDGRTHDRRVAATILGKTDSTEQCPTLTAERTGEAEIDDVSHYTVSHVVNGSLDSVEFGIAIVGLGPGNADPIDLALFEGDEAALYVDPHDHEALVAAIRCALARPEQGRLALERALKYTPDRMADRYLDLYERLAVPEPAELQPQ